MNLTWNGIQKIEDENLENKRESKAAAFTTCNRFEVAMREG